MAKIVAFVLDYMNSILVCRLNDLIIDNFYSNDNFVEPIGYTYLRYILENHFKLAQICAGGFYFSFPDCCKSFNEENNYTQNKYCYFDLLMSYGLNPNYHYSSCDFTINDYLSPKLGTWAHIYKFIDSNEFYYPVDFFIQLVEFQRFDLLNDLIVKYKDLEFEDERYILLNKCPAFQKQSSSIKLELLDKISRYQIKWIK